MPQGNPLAYMSQGLDPRFLSSALTNPYFGAVDAGSGSATAGNADGSGWLDWSLVGPEFSGAMDAAIGGTAGVSGGGAGPSMRSFLESGGYRLYDQPLGRGRYMRGIVGQDGKAIGGLQEVTDSNDDAFGVASALAALLIGGNVAGFAGGAQSIPLDAANVGLGSLPDGLSLLATGAAEAAPAAFAGVEGFATPALFGDIGASFGASLPELATGIGLGGGIGAGVEALAAGGLDSATRAALLSDAGYGEGMSGLQTSLYDNTVGLTGSPGLADMVARVGSGIATNPILGGIGSGLSRAWSTPLGRMMLTRAAGGLYGQRRMRRLNRRLANTDPTQTPGYRAGERAVRRAAAAGGYRNSSRMLAELQDFATQNYDRYAANQRAQYQAEAGGLANELNLLSLLSLGFGL